MLDQIIENIIHNIRQEVLQAGMNQVPLTYIFTRDIPDSIKHFFDQEVELWIREEREKFSASERFDYEMPEVQMLVDKVFDILKQTATFHINQFNRLLERAIKLEANYLIRPQQTLTQFLFKDNFVITTIEVYDMLKYFDKFQYYKDALTDYFNLKYLREISQTQFEELIKGIDQQVFSKNPLETTLQTIKTINNFINEGRSEPTDIISTKMLTMIFQDRNLNDYAELLEYASQEGTEELSISDLEHMLRTGKLPQEAEVEEVTPEPDFNLEEIVSIEEEKPEVQVETIDVPEQVAVPEDVIEAEFEEEEYPEEEEYLEEEEEEYLEEEEEEYVADQPADVDSESLTAVDQLASMVGEQMKGDHLEDLFRMISKKQRKKFVKKIFRKKADHYDEMISLLNKTPDWKNASNIIDDFFYQQGVNPYSREALEFSDLIYNRYFPKDISVNKGEEFRY